ncbi:MAG: hypothetical protein PHS41_04010 [Victivallaceae bacterium]|nr:hypothetical protein [Victivallaceae bacterium]
MHLTSLGNFILIAVLPDAVQALRFCRRRQGRYVLSDFASAKTIEGAAAPALAEVCKALAIHKREMIFVTGALEGGCFFQMELPELRPRETKEAIELELPRRMLAPPLAPLLEFAPVTVGSGSDADCPTQNAEEHTGSICYNVYAAEAKSFDRYVSFFSLNRLKIDLFLYPLMAMGAKNAPGITLPHLTPGYHFVAGAWEPGETPTQWHEDNFRKTLELPPEEKFSTNEYFEALLTAQYLITPESHNASNRFRAIVPESLRPRRLRKHLILFAILAAAMLLRCFSTIGTQRASDYREYKKLVAQLAQTRQENNRMREKLRRSDKELKELQRVTTLVPGEMDLLRKLGALSEVLPDNVLVMSLRWSENSVDLMLQSESTDPGLPAAIRKLSYWKIGQLQQRQNNNAISMISMKLLPPEEVVKPKSKARTK